MLFRIAVLKSNQNLSLKIKGGHIFMVFEKVRDILVEQLDLDESAVKLDAVIIDDLGADSLDIVDLVMSLEEEFDTEIPDEAIENIKTVGDVVKFIEDNLMQ